MAKCAQYRATKWAGVVSTKEHVKAYRRCAEDHDDDPLRKKQDSGLGGLVTHWDS